MKVSQLPRRALDLVQRALAAEAEPETSDALVAGAVVHRSGEHYAIAHGGDSDRQLAAEARHHTGHCDCGAPLSIRDDRQVCRACAREYRLH